MHQFAEWEIGNQDAQDKEMNIENHTNPFRHSRAEFEKAYGQFLYRRNVHPEKIPHEHSGQAQSKDQKQGEIICRK